MARGPLPNPASRRRNAPTIPTNKLPAAGRKGRAPAIPAPYTFKKAGKAWWKWAWSTPQAAAWDSGALYTVARRASLEDDLATLEHYEYFDLAELLGMEENDAIRQLEFVIGRLKRLAGGSTSVMKEMRELDKRLGLDPKALAELRWTIIDDSAPTTAAAAKPAAVAKGATVRRLHAVDPVAAGEG